LHPLVKGGVHREARKECRAVNQQREKIKAGAKNTFGHNQRAMGTFFLGCVEHLKKKMGVGEVEKNAQLGGDPPIWKAMGCDDKANKKKKASLLVGGVRYRRGESLKKKGGGTLNSPDLEEKISAREKTIWVADPQGSRLNQIC